MIYSISGIISAKSEEGVRLINSGMEWELTMSATSLQDLPGRGEEVRVFTWLYHREDAMGLFGFSNEEERTLFLQLIKVNGIGPKQAVKMLSAAPVPTFIRMVEEGSPEQLATLPGIGKKTASKILLSLKDRLVMPGEGSDAPSDEIVNALVEMGFDKKNTQRVVSKLRNESLSEQELMKTAIVELSGEN